LFAFKENLPMRHLLTTVSMGAALICVATCAPVENQRGYVPDMEAISSIQIGMDTKDTVSRKLGDPSSAATFGGDTWYYISAHVEQNAFFAPRATERNILAVEFAKDGKVMEVQRYSLADGRIVDFVTRETPTRGRDLTILQQIFNSVPGQIGAPGRGPIDTNPGGGGGPPPIPGPGR
jgi:outer membrane protein assembly factor BamE (lipoprotein component of BamABCDE complex)